jgi:hypothetical protein
MLSSEENSTTPRQTHYDVLQISHTATQDEIKAAYRSLVIGCHPDKLSSVHINDGASTVVPISETMSGIDIDDATTDEVINDEQRKTAGNHPSLSEIDLTKLQTEEVSEQNATTFHQLQAAYHCLRDPDVRRQYDESMSRTKEQEEWKWKGSSEVKLSDMESDWCCVVDEGNDENEMDVVRSTDESTILQKVFFYPCRCGDTFQVLQEEILGSIDDAKNVADRFTNRVWQCESCSLTIRIQIDLELDE